MVGSCNRRPRYDIIPQKVTSVAIIRDSAPPCTTGRAIGHTARGGISGHPKALTSRRSGGTTGTAGYRTGRVHPQDGGVLPGRLALEEAGPAHESRHGVVDHRRGYARGRRSVGQYVAPVLCGVASCVHVHNAGASYPTIWASFAGGPGPIGAGLCCIFEWTLAARFHKLAVPEVADEHQVLFS